jgi:hypothetical protein
MDQEKTERKEAGAEESEDGCAEEEGSSAAT